VVGLSFHFATGEEAAGVVEEDVGRLGLGMAAAQEFQGGVR
jgi:hypothetical protein